VTSKVQIPGAQLPFVRLSGFWNEPSNASASAFVAFFLARYLVIMGEGSFWRTVSYACLAAGILAFSNAGYLALGSALLIGLFFGVRSFTYRRLFQFAFLLPIATSLLLIVFFGRTYVAKELPDNVLALAITGLRDFESLSLDPSDGRIDLLYMTFNVIAERTIGVGIQEVGSNGIIASATAPLLWLLLTGIPGLFLLLCREIVLMVSNYSLLRKLPTMLTLTQALVVVMVQHLSYGNWMNPNYFILAGMLLVCSQRTTQKFFTKKLSHHD
jgi:hypothetical protein